MPIELATDSPASDENRAAQVLSEVQQFLREEEDLFGEMVMAEHSPVKHESVPSRSRKEAGGDELSLFDLPPPAKAPITREAWGSADSLDELWRQTRTCLKCTLGHTRTNFVFGVGNPQATLMLIGEAPGADEDAQGEPFVGRAGQLLNKILDAIRFKREEVYICNILKCRPPANRKPESTEMEQCLPYLQKQIELVKPKVILCLGLTAVENLLGTTEPLARLRGRVLSYEGIPLMVTYHPAALLRNPNWKRPTWEDVQAVRKLHDELVGGSAVMRRDENAGLVR